MEDLSQLNQKKQKRRLEATELVHHILLDSIDSSSMERSTLRQSVDRNPLNETLSCNMSIEQLDDYIKAYSQAFMKLQTGANQVKSKLNQINEMKKTRLARNNK